MKLEFTKIGQEKHDVLNNLFDIDFLDENNLDEVDYHDLSQNDQFILDMGMYINECYSDNEFNSIEEFAIETAGSEYQDIITEYYNTLAKECFNVPTHRFEMKTECVIRSAYFRATRRYAQWITKQEVGQP